MRLLAESGRTSEVTATMIVAALHLAAASGIANGGPAADPRPCDGRPQR